jgi:flagellar biosynthesis/type III secretory pathway chaperone
MYDKFHGFLTELEGNFTKLSQLLHNKLAALERFDIDRLDAIIKEEQVFVLLSKSFDANVASYRQKLGLSGEKLSDIIGELPVEEQARFQSTFQRLKAALDEVKTLNLKCQDLIEERLYSLDKAIKELDRSAGATYSKQGDDAKRSGDHPHLLSKSI